MREQLLPEAGTDDEATAMDPQVVAERFLAALAAGDTERASALVADDIDYVNVGLPAIHGRTEVDKVLRLLDRPDLGFEVYLHSVAADGPVVLTERSDVLVIGRLRIQFWVWGRFDVQGGKITLWRDSFDMVDIVRGTVRGVLALFVPGLAPAVPSGSAAAPGR
jgi:limonene-1,2-epoxide hydrolase